MKRHEEADSGLRAGFVHEDELKQIKQNVPVSEQVDTVDEAAKAKEETKAKALAAAEAKAEKAESELASGPTVSVQGVSGKMITGVIKAVKKRKNERRGGDTAETAKKEAATVETVAKKEEPAATPAAEKTAPAEKVAKPGEPVAEKKMEPKPESKPAAATEIKPAAKPEPEIITEKKTEPAAKPAPKTTSKPKTEATAPAAAAQKEETASKAKTEQALEETANTAKASKQAAAKSAPAEPRAQARKEHAASTKTTASAATKAKTTEPKAATEEKKEVKSDRPRIKEDQGIIISAQERMARAGKTIIRPQSGNYVGRNTERPARPQGGDHRGRSDERGRKDDRRRSGGYQNQRSSGPKQERFFDKDKDEDETPRRTRSPKPRKRADAMPDSSVINAQKDVSRRNFRERTQREKDKDQRRSAGWRSQEELELDEEIARRGRRRKAKAQSQKAAPAKSQLSEVSLPANLSVKELAEILKKTSAEVITKLISYGVMATVNQEIDFDTAAIVAGDFGIQATLKEEVSEEDILFDDSDDKEEDLQPRPPVVVVMGHVDHGKTSILDWIRNSRVASGEAGGITQHIGAYMVDVHDRKITFLDTPGHEAFTMIRQRGAQVTDIAVLVVAADDGVMPQTIEAINHAKAAGTEIIVAINKIDKGTANIDRVKQELAQYGIMDADWGGTNTIVPVSAKTGQNMEELLEMILLTADVLDLKANPDRQAKGTVIEASLDKSRGALATLLVQRGTLHQGDAIVVGTMMGNVRAMFNDRHEPITEAGPSVPVEIMGLPDVPEAGDIFYEVENEKVARSLVERRQAEEREEALRASQKLSLDNLFEQMNDGETKDLNIIVKADVQGSAQAMSSSLAKLSTDEVKVNIIHSAVGAITASDVRLADVSEAIIIGFNVRPPANVVDLAKEANVEIRLYRVIYEALDDVQKAMKGLLDPVYEEGILGRAEVRETFKASGVGTIAGCYVTSGVIRRNAEVRLVRDGIVIHEGKLASLRRFQDDVREVQQGYECGISIERFNDIKVGDEIECFHMVELER
ncbi:MAG: translation initiation factor IF-2 [Eubacteriales bacterium]|nr:translation initiation factor IF-2 [Eubacteriales bacterium]